MPSNGTAPELGGGSAPSRGPAARPLLTDGVIDLGRLAPADAPCIAVACSDPDTQRWLPLPDPYTVDDALAFIRRQDQAWTADAEWIFGVRPAGQTALAGTVGVHGQEPGVVTLGYWTAPGFRRLGFAARAVLLAALFAFDDLCVRWIEIVVDENNAASCSTARKAGARQNGRRFMTSSSGRQVTAVVYSLTREELEAAAIERSRAVASSNRRRL